jgi:malate permease and related proteins
MDGMLRIAGKKSIAPCSGRANVDAGTVLSAGPIITAVLPAYLLILLGVVLRKSRILRQEHDEPLMHVVFHVMYPCFILDKILGSAALRSGSVVGWSIGIGFCELLVGMAVGIIAGKCIRLEKGSGLRTFAFSVGIQNFGFTAIPIVQSLWGAAAVSVLMVHNLGVELSIWTFGVMVMSNDKQIPWKKLINGPALSVVVGLLLVALGVDEKITGPFREMMKWLGSGAFPLALLVTGAIMIDMVSREKPSLRIAVMGSLLRLFVIPLMILASAKYLPLALELKQVLIVQAAMPAAMSPLLVAKLYGGRPGIAAQIIVVTTMLSLLTLPWMIAFGMRWVLG